MKSLPSVTGIRSARPVAIRPATMAAHRGETARAGCGLAVAISTNSMAGSSWAHEDDLASHDLSPKSGILRRRSSLPPSLPARDGHHGEEMVDRRWLPGQRGVLGVFDRTAAESIAIRHKALALRLLRAAV